MNQDIKVLAKYVKSWIDEAKDEIMDRIDELMEGEELENENPFDEVEDKGEEEEEDILGQKEEEPEKYKGKRSLDIPPPPPPQKKKGFFGRKKKE